MCPSVCTRQSTSVCSSVCPSVCGSAGLSEEGVKVMCSIWALEPEGRVSVEKWEDLEEDLQQAGRRDLARLMGSALVKRSHDPTSVSAVG